MVGFRVSGLWRRSGRRHCSGLRPRSGLWRRSG
jgi:hypothetical protein